VFSLRDEIGDSHLFFLKENRKDRAHDPTPRMDISLKDDPIKGHNHLEIWLRRRNNQTGHTSRILTKNGRNCSAAIPKLIRAKPGSFTLAHQPANMRNLKNLNDLLTRNGIEFNSRRFRCNWIILWRQ
jgi:hypothetical protein